MRATDNSSIVSQLNSTILRQIKNIFGELQPNVKQKLLLAFLHISRRNLDEVFTILIHVYSLIIFTRLFFLLPFLKWKEELESILESALDDQEQWVSVIGEMLRNYPRHGTINFDFQANSSTFMELVNEIKKTGMYLFV